LLLLFDIDGTLLRGADDPHFEALYATLERDFSVPNAAAVSFVMSGRTDLEIARLVMESRGLGAARVSEVLRELPPRWIAEFARRCPADLSSHVTPGMDKLISRLNRDSDVRLALVTGNLEAIARLKLERAGMGSAFLAGQGAFGSDSAIREELPPIARARAGPDGRPHPRADTILIGDTPRDIACAHADRLRCFAIATGRYQPKDLRAAEAVARDAMELGALVDNARE
jgi:phosphoglycolate phosphatase-like HAD superfamily hydrolase